MKLTRRSLRVFLIAALVSITLIVCWPLGKAAFYTVCWMLPGAWRAGFDFTGTAKVLEDDLRTFYHGKSHFPEYTLEQLRDMGVIDHWRYDDIKFYDGEFHSFSSTSPDDQIVLRIRYLDMTLTWTKAGILSDAPHHTALELQDGR